MKLITQRDPLWSTIKLGRSSLTIGRYGCTTCCISMVSDHFGKYVSPDKIARNEGNYTSGGLIIWGNLNLQGMKFVKRLRLYSFDEVMKSLNDPNQAVLLEVNHGQHWIVAMRKMWLKKDFICADPWTGKTCAALGDYYNITGSAHFQKV